MPELIPFMDWLSKPEVQLDTILCLVSTAGIWVLIVCVYSISGAMGKVSKPVAAVVPVAIGPYCSLCLMSHV